MERRRLIYILLAVIAIIAAAVSTYLVVVATPAVLEPGDRSSSHDDIDCLRCHAEYEGVSDDLCLDCHEDMTDRDWHVETRGQEACAKCHYEHVDADYITDLTQVPPCPREDLLRHGKHSRLRCVECHVANGAVEEDCAFCHERYIGGTHAVGFVPDCSLCHETTIWEVDYDHDEEEVYGCADCHGADPPHKLEAYNEWDEDCSVCHGTEVWLLPEFPHDDILEPCDACHPASLDIPWGGTSSNCSHCHDIYAWSPPRIDHDVLELACDRCHVDERPPDHLELSVLGVMDCDACHGVERWNRTIDHELYIVACLDCHQLEEEDHDDEYAEDCQFCHGTEHWEVGLSHPGILSECTMCHPDAHEGGDPEDSVDAAHSRLCAACHVPGESWELLVIDHGPLGLDCAACHVSTHEPIGGREAGCEACHGNVTWLPTSVDHDVLGEDCLACHVDPHPNAYDQWSGDCTLCHAQDDWAIRLWDHEPRNETDTPCVNCHNDIHLGTLGILCEDCHTTDTWETDVITP